MAKLKHYADWAINFIFRKNNKEKTPLLYYWTKRYLLTLCGGLLIIGIISILWIRHNALENRLELTKLVAQEIAEHANEMVEGRLKDIRLPFLQDRQKFINEGQPLDVFLKDAAGNIRSMNQNFPPDSREKQLLIKSLPLVSELTIKKVTLWNNQKASVVIAPIIKDGTPTGSVYIIQPHNQLQHLNKEEYQLLGLLLLSLALLGWFVIYSLSKKMAKPVEEVANAAQQLMNGNYHITLNEEVQEKELYQLMLSFNEMTKRLYALESLRTQLLAGVTHELKTPITSISALIQAVNDNVIPEKKKSQFLLMSLKEAGRLQSMVEDLLDFNSFSAGSIKVNKEKLNVQATLKEIIYQWEIVHTESLSSAKLTFINPEKSIFTMLDSVRFQQIIVNLLNNSLHAIKGKQGGKITIRLTHDDQNIIILVEDNGYGIPKEEQAYIFERFYRGKNKKDIERGLGLGLPYSLLLAKAQGGHLSLQNSDGRSTIFLLQFPILT
ncbi:HAMP domain-containing histidine kinase [Bacillus circulans]|uniref:HAMP domain-containing sensor histidine kinase n=1 Tax=Niallia circulans TaxID=1397 RepID=UPI00155FC471|nr:HAMP domain-containing sensor histidine kinase [Niallia circulans]NRG26473.1 HAMP domain-containing histidine kinase [Niallia circulans]